MAISNHSFEVPASVEVYRVTCRHQLWQKERLINLLIDRLPKQYKKVVWSDCDVLFEDPNWLYSTSAELENFQVVQPFSTAIRLPQRQHSTHKNGERYVSFGCICSVTPEAARLGTFEKHGHTGFAWAAHRDFLQEVGLYDACLSGSGDHLMAHAFLGDFNSACLQQTFGAAEAYYKHFKSWAEKAFALVNGKISFVPGQLFHLWHGNSENRQYMLRNQELMSFNYNPERDIYYNIDGCWEIRHQDSPLYSWSLRFFSERNEDGSTQSS
jgi:hypothetical protein